MVKTILHKASDRFEVRSDRGSSYFSFSFGDRYREDRLGFGALRVINDDTIPPGMGFGSHPHDNMEIISIVLEGEVTHRDNLGTESISTPRRLQVISAGTGLYHSEVNENAAATCSMLQIWVYPDRLNVKPHYQQADYTFPPTPGAWELVIAPLAEGAAPQVGAAAPLVGAAVPPVPAGINQSAWFHLGNLPSDSSQPYTLKKEGNGLYVFVIEGSVSVEGQNLGYRDGLGISGAEKVNVLALSPSLLLLMEVPMVDFMV
jgi:redox-sensitive bicupin YhaK (pirin superfamily)